MYSLIDIKQLFEAMSNRLSIFYEPFLYLAILLFLLGEGTVWLEFARKWIPVYSHSVVTTIVLVATILLGFVEGVRKEALEIITSRNMMLAISPVILFGLACYTDVIINMFSSNISASYIAFFVRHFLFIFLVVQALACGRPFNVITKPYYHVMLFVLLTGFCLFILSFVVDNIADKTIDISFLRKAEEGNLGKSLYSMPYGLGLLITGQNLASFLGFDFYQFSSYFIEPQIFGFMMVPAFIIFLQRDYKTPATVYRVPMILVTIILIFWAHSFTTLAALIGLGLVWIGMRNIIGTVFVLIVFSLALVMVITNLDDLSLSLSLIKKLGSESSEGSVAVFVNIWETLRLTGDGTLNIRVGDKGEYLSAMSLLFWASFVISVLINVVNELWLNKNSVFAYVLLFLLICFFKSLGHLPQSPISIYICLIFFAYKYTNEVTRSLNVKP